MKKLFSLLAFVVSLTLCGSGIDLSSLAPSYTAAAGKIDVAVLMQMPEARQFLSDMPQNFNGIAPRDMAEIFCGTDAQLTRGFMICRFSGEEAWQRLWRSLEKHIEPLHAERRILLFELKKAVPAPAKVYFAILAPYVAGFYYESSGGKNFRCDYAGCSEKMRKVYRNEKPFFGKGEISVTGSPLSGVNSFYATVMRDDNGMPEFFADVVCKNKVSASVTLVFLRSALALALQEFCGLTQEQTVGLMRRVNTVQYDNRVQIEFSDFDYLAQMMHKMVIGL